MSSRYTAYGQAYCRRASHVASALALFAVLCAGTPGWAYDQLDPPAAGEDPKPYPQTPDSGPLLPHESDPFDGAMQPTRLPNSYPAPYTPPAPMAKPPTTSSPTPYTPPPADPYYPPEAATPEQDPAQQQDAPEREGLTFRAAMGGGMTALIYSQGDSQGYVSWNALNLGAGFFFSKQLSLMFQTSAILFGPFNRVFENGYVLSFAPALQWWFYDWLNLEGSVGLGINYLKYRGGPSLTQLGPLFSVMANAALFTNKHNAAGLFVAVSTVPSQESTLSVQFGISWQYY